MLLSSKILMIVICECCNILQIESISTKLQGSEAPNVLWSTFCDSTAGSLTTLELEDVSIDGKKGLFTAPRKTRCSFKACAFLLTKLHDD